MFQDEKIYAYEILHTYYRYPDVVQFNINFSLTHMVHMHRFFKARFLQDEKTYAYEILHTYMHRCPDIVQFNINFCAHLCIELVTSKMKKLEGRNFAHILQVF